MIHPISRLEEEKPHDHLKDEENIFDRIHNKTSQQCRKRKDLLPQPDKGHVQEATAISRVLTQTSGQEQGKEAWLSPPRYGLSAVVLPEVTRQEKAKRHQLI